MSKSSIKNNIDNLLVYQPYNLYIHSRSFLKARFNSNLKVELEKNKNLKDLYNGKKCFIIGNGPSLKKQDLSHLENEYTFVTNNFILHEKVMDIKPNFYCIVDPMIHNGTFPIERIREIEKQLPETKMFLRYKSKEFINTNNLFSNGNVHYLNDDAYLSENYSFEIGLDRCIPSSINVVLSCIMIASYMGFKEIYLLGCDATLFIPNPDHFYTATKEEEEKRESMEDKLLFASYMFKGYRILNDYYSKKGVNIYNSTDGGVLDVFPKKPYIEAINKRIE